MRTLALLLVVLGSVASPALAQSAPVPAAPVPAALVRPGDEPVMTLTARGAQIYECRGAAGGPAIWAFKEPRADLFLDGKPFGRHYGGPTWEGADGGRIVGKVAANAPAPDAADIPWLRLSVASRAGEGALAAVGAVQRIDTKGGVLAGPCETAGSVREEPYTATYVMLRTAG